jgi:hypothetical protein
MANVNCLYNDGIIPNKSHGSLKLLNLLPGLYVLMQRAVMLNKCRVVRMKKCRAVSETGDVLRTIWNAVAVAVA